MKISVLILAAVLTVACAANSFAAFAWLVATPTPGAAQNFPKTGNIPQASVTPSANVVVGYDTVAGATYSLGTYHTSGTFTYGTSSTDTGMYRKENASGNATQADVTKVPNAAASVNDQVDWTTGGWTLSK